MVVVDGEGEVDKTVCAETGQGVGERSEQAVSPNITYKFIYKHFNDDLMKFKNFTSRPFYVCSYVFRNMTTPSRQMIGYQFQFCMVLLIMTISFNISEYCIISVTFNKIPEIPLRSHSKIQYNLFLSMNLFFHYTFTI